ncbi:MAG: hypothetical protein R2847_07020 [Bacteroidia bacterium]
MGGGTSPLQYSIDNGSYQSGNSFQDYRQTLIRSLFRCKMYCNCKCNITEPTQVTITSTPTVDANCLE